MMPRLANLRMIDVDDEVSFGYLGEEAVKEINACICDVTFITTEPYKRLAGAVSRAPASIRALHKP